MATTTTQTSAKAWSMDVRGFAALDVVPEAIILQASSVAGAVEGDEPAVRVPYVDDAAAGFVAEGATIEESDPELSEVLVHTGKIAQLVRLSREQFHTEDTDELVSESVRRAVVKAANVAFLRQAVPTPPAVTPPSGVANVAGVVDGGAVGGNLDALIDLIATIESNEGQATHIIVDPIGWASLRKFKTGSGSEQSLLGAGVVDTVKTLLDLPVLITSALAAGTGLVVDRAAIVSAVGEVKVAQSEHIYFDSDSVGLRCTWRFGQNIVKPNRVGKFTVTAPAAA